MSKTCAQCHGEIYSPEEDGQLHPGRLYCSWACRQKAYRERKRGLSLQLEPETDNALRRIAAEGGVTRQTLVLGLINLLVAHGHAGHEPEEPEPEEAVVTQRVVTEESVANQTGSNLVAKPEPEPLSIAEAEAVFAEQAV